MFERKDSDLFSLPLVEREHGPWSFPSSLLVSIKFFVEDISSGSITRPGVTYHGFIYLDCSMLGLGFIVWT